MKAPTTSSATLIQRQLPYSRPTIAALDLADCGVIFPLTPVDRAAFLRPTGKKVTAFQWRLYDAVTRIPAGRVTTYGALATQLNSSARAVGSALRNNPFAPRIACHRIVAADGFVGGFFGEWGKDGEHVKRKLDMLRKEGVHFDSRGYLIGGVDAIWKG